MPSPAKRNSDEDGPAFLDGSLPRWAGRIVAACVGAAVEYRTLFVADEVDYFLFLAGLWLMGIPFASLLETLRKLVEIQGGLAGGSSNDQQMDETPRGGEEDDTAATG